MIVLKCRKDKIKGINRSSSTGSLYRFRFGLFLIICLVFYVFAEKAPQEKTFDAITKQVTVNPNYKVQSESNGEIESVLGTFTLAKIIIELLLFKFCV